MEQPQQEHLDYDSDRVLKLRPYSRRGFLRGSLGLGLSIPVISALLAACGGDDDDAEDGEDTGDEPTATTKPEDGGDDPTEEDSSSSGSPEGQVVYGGLDVDEPSSLFSGAALGADAIDAFRLIANALVRLQSPEMTVEPDLAESWEVSDDATTFNFTLHEGVTWQDGEPFSANDVKFSFELWAHPDWPEDLPPVIALIEGAQEYKEGTANEITGVTVADDTNASFTLTSGDSLFLAQLSERRILPQHLLTDVDASDVEADPFARQPIYTGPFILEEWRPTEAMIFRAFPDSFSGGPNIERFVRRITADPATAVAELRSGEADIGLIPADSLSQFEDDDNFRILELAGGVAWFWSFDLTLPLFSDKRVRQAMNHALDRQAVIDAIFLGMGEPVYGVTSPQQWIYNPDAPRFEYDEERANALLDEAGWVVGDDGIREKDDLRLQFGLNVTDTTQSWAIAAQPFMEAVGIQVDLNFMDFGTWIANLQLGSYEAAYNGWGQFSSDPRTSLENLFRVPRSGVDWSGYDNSEVNELFEQAHLTSSRDEQLDIYHQIEALVAEDAPFVFTWSPTSLYVVRSNLEIPDVENLPQLYDTAPEWMRQG